MHRPSISSIEAGRRSVSAEELGDFSDLYGVSAAWLVCDEQPEQSAREAAIALAARGLANVHPDELDRLLRLLRTLKAG
jgi:hypothetical protein